MLEYVSPSEPQTGSNDMGQGVSSDAMAAAKGKARAVINARFMVVAVFAAGSTYLLTYLDRYPPR